MDVVSHVPAIPQQFLDGPVRTTMAANRGIVEDSVTQATEEKVYVAVGKDLKESKLTLLWALQNSGGKKICLLHVHQPAQMIPMMGGKFPASRMKEQEVRAYRELERQSMYMVLKEYLRICDTVGIQAEEVHIEADCIEKGIVENICRHGIKKLVMGGAGDKHYSRRKMDIKSKKAVYVRLQAPAACEIWFICKGHLIHTRKAILDGVGIDTPPIMADASPITEITQPSPLRSHSVTLRQNNEKIFTSPFQYMIRRDRSVNTNMHGRGVPEVSSPNESEQVTTSLSRLDTEGSIDESDGTSRQSPSQNSRLSTCSSNEPFGVALAPFLRSEGNGNGLELSALTEPKNELHHSSSSSLLEGSVNDELYDQLEQALVEAQNSRQEAFEESLRRGKAEKVAIEAIRRAKAAESLYNEELKQRKIFEEAILKEQEEFEKMKNQKDEVMEELRVAMDQKRSLDNQVADSDEMVKELEEKIISAVDLLQNYKTERDALQFDRDNALKVAEEMRKKQTEMLSTTMLCLFSEFSFLEIEEATQHFDQSLKIGEGGYGSIYKGLLRHTEVAIKMLNPQSLQGPSEYQQEVDVLSKLRHPNLVTLFGACPEAWALVYKYLPNGSLEDRLARKDNSPPLPWQTRIRIATELCSVLIFLHSNKPCGIVHGDLKPANILLDANFVSKLSDFGICRKICHDEILGNGSTLCCRTNPKGTFVYMDPEFLATGELTPKSDVYSFGIILLRLLTGRPGLGIIKEVKYALDNGSLNSLLDYSAGDWPFVQAHQLVHSALRCTEMNRRDRPDLQSDVWRVLEPMRVSWGGSLSSFRLGSEELCLAPHYFLCPIFQEIMQDPHVAADGFTYEAEALRGWIDSGHDTSPVTNLKLAHTNLVPNHALRFAIQEWLHQH